MSLTIRPHTASTPPARPQSSYSTRSTIRRVTPSPDCLNAALSRNFPAYSTPRLPDFNKRPEDCECGRPWSVGPGSDTRLPFQRSGEILTRRLTPTRIPRPTTTTATTSDDGSALKRSHEGQISPTKRKSGGLALAAPRKHRSLTTANSLPSHQEDRDVDPIVAQKMSLPTDPLDNVKLRNRHQGTGSHKHNIQEQQRHPRPEPFTIYPDADLFLTPKLLSPLSHSLTVSPYPLTDADEIHPASPHKQTSPARPLKRQRTVSTFSTPGRDEMERKEAEMRVFDGDEGPFGGAKGVKDLEARRKRVNGDVGNESVKKSEVERWEDGEECCGCGCRCLVM